MDSLLDSLLHSHRVGRLELALEDVDLSGVLAEAIEMVGHRSEDSTGETKVVIPRPLPTTRCELVRRREFLLKLLSNALKCIDEPRKIIEVGCTGPGESHARPGCPEDQAGKTICYLKDNGIGIQPKHPDQILKMFKHLLGRDEYAGGAGAGLTIVNRLVERYRGHVWLDSCLSEGTTFCFTLCGAEETWDDH